MNIHIYIYTQIIYAKIHQNQRAGGFKLSLNIPRQGFSRMLGNGGAVHAMFLWVKPENMCWKAIYSERLYTSGRTPWEIPSEKPNI